MDVRAIFETIVRFLDESDVDTPKLFFDRDSEYVGEIVAVDPITKETCRITIFKGKTK